MLLAIGWVVVRSPRDPYRVLAELPTDERSRQEDVIDDRVDAADQRAFAALVQHLGPMEPPDLDWHFRGHMNNDRGLLTFSSSRNRRGGEPTAVQVLRWCAVHASGSYGLVYIHDDEDMGGRTGLDHSNVFRVWRLRRGEVAEVDDPHFSPIVPTLVPNHFS